MGNVAIDRDVGSRGRGTATAVRGAAAATVRGKERDAARWCEQSRCIAVVAVAAASGGGNPIGHGRSGEEGATRRSREGAERESTESKEKAEAEAGREDEGAAGVEEDGVPDTAAAVKFELE